VLELRLLVVRQAELGRIMMDRLRYFRVLRNCGLEACFSDFVVRNRSNDVPYHNLWHTQLMIELCHEGAVSEGLSPDQTASLVCAAIWHDFDHTAGPGSDDVNIARALEGFKTAQVPDNVDRVAVEHCIRATEFPHRDWPGGLDAMQMIIRDADLMMPFMPTFHTHVIRGLCAEKGLSVVVLLEKQLEFVSGIHWNTEWGRACAAACADAVSEEVDFLRKIYGPVI
jgi:hypothetical protein